MPTILLGYVSTTSGTTTETTAHVTFSKTFRNVPHVFVSLVNTSYNRRVHSINSSTTGTDIVLALQSGSGVAAIEAVWLAIGYM